MAEVQERLEARFPQFDPTVVAAAIQVAAAGISGPVRDFVPLLVERAARERLSQAVGGATTVGDDVPQRAETLVAAPSAPVTGPEVNLSLGH